MKRSNKVSILLVSIPIVLLLFFASNIYGYFRFQSYCSSEGGLKVYELLEKNVGWWAKDKYDAKAAALLTGIGFVRYEDDGKTFDLKYIGGNPSLDESFEVRGADDSKSLNYSWHLINQALDKELRLRKYGREVFDFNTNKTLVSYYFFGYEKFNRGRTPLDMPSEVYCFNDVTDFNNAVSGWVKSMSTAFKN